jgi:anti-sigma B factor antagonist
MKAHFIVQDGVTVVELQGYMDFETAYSISRSIDEIYRKDKQAKVVINLRGLEFVGSSGISSFVKNMRVFNTLKVKPSYCGVKSEFVRLFRAFEEKEPFEVMETLDEARSAAHTRYDEWQAKTIRSRRTH